VTGSDWQVLVVEDEIDSRDVVQDLLHYHGVRCQSTGTAEDALHLLQTVVPDMVVIDLALPAMDGWGLLRAIRDDRRLANVPCVAVTAYHSVEVARKAVQAGFAGYFAKPIDPGTFVQDLAQLVHH
jgi:CheY-like chemotaxis protein